MNEIEPNPVTTGERIAMFALMIVFGAGLCMTAWVMSNLNPAAVTATSPISLTFFAWLAGFVVSAFATVR